MHKERLLNVARALRESPNHDDFSMGDYGTVCGTPACALGHYAARGDLQDAFKLSRGGWLLTRDGSDTHYNRHEVLAHFEISPLEAEDLFSISGCGYARTALEAAEFIERYVEQSEAEP